ncbi:hypothetical protein Lfu02_75810 [Longispora fulva]|uniref:DNA-binding XRE family transcriptional regulator n=1 Tax=Longispora fulva TaxID=619741 RepID=A0A8J7GGI7_9ACTN|nr:helix-turn-helix domain-containing protein [Longispora fulva]MBG6136282.1 DNA-binding XRE family transcriptional regulator [Longispora fulva]GIG63209.1 hypothetical protein Lfu02_75810 [Longispora fulva]
MATKGAPLGPLGNPAVEIARLVRHCRARMTSADIPDWVGPPRTKLTQEVIAHRIGCSLVTYGHLENGQLRRMSTQLAEAVASALCMTDSERYLLHWLGTGMSAPGVHPTTEKLVASLRLMMHAVPWPAWMSDPAGNIFDRNPRMTEWMPDTAGSASFIAWVLTAAPAREQLVDWETTWMPAAVAYVRMISAMAPTDPRIVALIRGVVEPCALARSLWENSAVQRIQPGADIASQPLWLRVRGKPVEVSLTVLTPPGASEGRFVELIPLGT